MFLETHGVQDLQTKVPITERSLFRIYSMSKAVTAVAVMTLFEEGRFQLTDSVAKYLPEFSGVTVASGTAVRAPARDITVRDLLLHSSGLNHRTSAPYREAHVRSRRFPTSRVVENMARVPLLKDPGVRWRYSEAPTVLGRLIEIWSGMPLDRFLSERLFRPLGMVDTGFWVQPDRRQRLTTVYTPAAEGFCQMLLNKGHLDGVRILGRKTVEMITANALPVALLPMAGEVPGSGWALGNVAVVLDPREFPYPATTGEYSWGGSAGTSFWVDPTEATIALYMAPIFPANPESLAERFKTLVYQSFVD